jgi:hypothetical protein
MVITVEFQRASCKGKEASLVKGMGPAVLTVGTTLVVGKG